jgi:predicted MFS family arabinose efflux permease
MSQGLLVRSRSFRLYWSARTASIAGNQIARVALTVLVYRLGGGAAGVSILLLAFTLPRLLGPLAGAIADRSDNKFLMVSCDLAQAVLFAALAWVRWWPAVVGIVLVATLFATAYLPAGRGNIPVIVGRENLTRANALLATGSNTALALGPALGGLLLAAGGPGPALIVNAGTFVLSAVLTLGIPRLRPGAGTGRWGAAALAGMRGGGRPVTLLGQARLGLGEVWRNRVARAIAVMLLPSVAFASLDNAALIFLIRQGFHAGAGTYAWMVTVFSVGMVGAPLLASVRWRPGARALLFGGEGVFGAGTVATGLAPGLAAGLGAQLVAGAGNGVENVGMDTLLQESAPDERLGMVFGTVYAALYAGQIIAYAVATPVIVLLGPRATFVLAGAGVLASLAVLAWMLPSPATPTPTPAGAGAVGGMAPAEDANAAGQDNVAGQENAAGRDNAAGQDAS